MIFLMIFSALKAIEAGVDGIVVSNHGARQLDYSPATITVLEEVKNPSKLLRKTKLILLYEHNGLLFETADCSCCWWEGTGFA